MGLKKKIIVQKSLPRPKVPIIRAQLTNSPDTPLGDKPCITGSVSYVVLTQKNFLHSRLTGHT